MLEENRENKEAKEPPPVIIQDVPLERKEYRAKDLPGLHQAAQFREDSAQWMPADLSARNKGVDVEQWLAKFSNIRLSKEIQDSSFYQDVSTTVSILLRFLGEIGRFIFYSDHCEDMTDRGYLLSLIYPLSNWTDYEKKFERVGRFIKLEKVEVCVHPLFLSEHDESDTIATMDDLLIDSVRRGRIQFILKAWDCASDVELALRSTKICLRRMQGRWYVDSVE